MVWALSRPRPGPFRVERFCATAQEILISKRPTRQADGATLEETGGNREEERILPLSLALAA